MSANGNVVSDFGANPIPIGINHKLNIRDGSSRSAKIVRRVEPPMILYADQVLEAESVSENAIWYREAQTGSFFWSGGGSPLPPDSHSAPTTMKLNVRSDKTILPLKVNEINQVFGLFTYQDHANGSITITTPGWESQNIVAISHPLLSHLHMNSLRVHKKARPCFIAALDAIEKANLGHLLLTCSGTFVPRHIGWNSAKALSSHSWGIAIDFNAEWNGYGKAPAAPGTQGTLQEIVPFFAAQGFAWGGHFSAGYRDGMHFELARLDL